MDGIVRFVLLMCVVNVQCAVADWADVTNNTFYDVDLERKVLKLQSDSKATTRTMAVELCSTDGSHIMKLSWRFSDYKINIEFCTETSYVNSMVGVPDVATRNWTIARDKTNKKITIAANDVKVFSLAAADVNSTVYSDCADKIGSTMGKIKFSVSNAGTGDATEAAKKYLVEDWVVLPTGATTSKGKDATLQCEIVYVNGGAEISNQTWKWGTALSLDFETVGDANTTYPMTWTNNVYTFKFIGVPSFDMDWTCYFVFKLASVETIIEGTAPITVITITMYQPYIMTGYNMSVVCNVSNTALTKSNPEFKWGATTYSVANTTSAGIQMVTLGDYVSSSKSILLTFFLPAASVSATMEKAFECYITVSSVVHTGKGTAAAMSFVANPVAVYTLETLPVTLNCTLNAVIVAGTVQWWRENGTDSGNYTAYNNKTVTAASVNVTDYLKFSAIEEADDNKYYCRFNFTESTIFGGGHIDSTAARIDVVEEGTAGVCWLKVCATSTGTCTGNAHNVVKTSTACVYVISLDLGNNIKQNVRCTEPTTGCAATVARSTSNDITLTGYGSSMTSTGDVSSNLTIYGKKGSIVANKQVVGNETIASSSNVMTVNCSEATSATDTCKIDVKSGYYGKYYCIGPSCTLLHEAGYEDLLVCTGTSCTVTEGAAAEYSTIYAEGHYATVTATGASNPIIYVSKNYNYTVITLTGISTGTVETKGSNPWAKIYNNETKSTTPMCRGEHCQVYTYGGLYSTSNCVGFNCTAYGKNISNDASSIKVECWGRDCTAQCDGSVNCTAQCNGMFCKAICANNTGYCKAICNGSYCGTTCQVKSPSSTCETLELPKKSKCSNCLYTPKIWNWSVCMGDYPDCESCYVASFDLLGLEMYRLGCLDNQTKIDACSNNTFILACYLDFCYTDYCTTTKMKSYINSSSLLGCSLDTVVMATALLAQPAVLNCILYCVTILLTGMYDVRNVIR